MAQFIGGFACTGNRLGDLDSHGFAEALTQAVDRDLERPIAHAELRGGDLPTRGIADDPGFQSFELRRLAGLAQFLADGVERASKKRVGPFPVKKGFLIEDGRGVDPCIQHDVLGAASAFEGEVAFSQIAQVMAQRGEQVAAKAASLRIRAAEEAAFEDTGKKRVGEFARIILAAAFATKEFHDGTVVDFGVLGDKFLGTKSTV